MIIRCQAHFQGLTGLPEDRFVNDLYVEKATFGLLDAINFRTAWSNFFNVVHTDKVADFMADYIDRSTDAAVITFYNAEVEGPPLYLLNWTLAAIGEVQSLPAEVALAVSYHADLDGIPERQDDETAPHGFIRPRARRRGRFFVGPLNVAALGDDAVDCRPNPDLVDCMAAAAGAMVDELDASGIDWQVYSRAAGESYDVVEGWIDNAFDTQRRRGVKASARTAWSGTP